MTILLEFPYKFTSTCKKPSFVYTGNFCWNSPREVPCSLAGEGTTSLGFQVKGTKSGCGGTSAGFCRFSGSDSWDVANSAQKIPASPLASDLPWHGFPNKSAQSARMKQLKDKHLCGKTTFVLICRWGHQAGPCPGLNRFQL